MNTKALYNLTYGVYLLSARDGEKDNACIINTAVQVANNPTRISVAVIKANLTNEIIAKTGRFNLSAITTEAEFRAYQAEKERRRQAEQLQQIHRHGADHAGGLAAEAAAGVEHPVQQRDEGAVGGGVIHRRADDQAVGVLHLLQHPVHQVVVKHAAAGIFLTPAAGGAAPDGLAHHVEDLRLHPFTFQGGGNLPQSGGGAAVHVGAAVEQKYFHMKPPYDAA